MDHIIENEGKPVPDLAVASESSSARQDGMDVDDDEDAEALKSLGAAAGNVEAKVLNSPYNEKDWID